MSVQALIRQAHDAGVELRLVDGKVKAVGPRAAVASMLEPLRQHREELIMDLTGWRVLRAAYQVHHLGCATCVAAERIPAVMRCGTGSALWREYTE